MSIMLVTGYTHIKDHPRKHEEYQKLFEKLQPISDLLDGPVYFNQQDINRCWLYQWLDWSGVTPTHSVGDNPAKNSLAYHIVQHQKLLWLMVAGFENPKVDTFAWVDMGIHSVPGVTNEIIAAAIQRADGEKTITIPGCWGRSEAKLVPDSQVNWRFCGGFFIVPRKYLFDFEAAFRCETMSHLRDTNNLSWEVNTLQRLELKSPVRLPIWWYQADHNETLFTNYPGTQNAS